MDRGGIEDHTMRGIAGGFMQACHGKAAPLKRMMDNDWVIFYPPNHSINGAVRCQAFTIIGEVNGSDVYEFAMSKDLFP